MFNILQSAALYYSKFGVHIGYAVVQILKLKKHKLFGFKTNSVPLSLNKLNMGETLHYYR